MTYYQLPFVFILHGGILMDLFGWIVRIQMANRRIFTKKNLQYAAQGIPVYAWVACMHRCVLCVHNNGFTCSEASGRPLKYATSIFCNFLSESYKNFSKFLNEKSSGMYRPAPTVEAHDWLYWSMARLTSMASLCWPARIWLRFSSSRCWNIFLSKWYLKKNISPKLKLINNHPLHTF